MKAQAREPDSSRAAPPTMAWTTGLRIRTAEGRGARPMSGGAATLGRTVEAACGVGGPSTSGISDGLVWRSSKEKGSVIGRLP